MTKFPESVRSLVRQRAKEQCEYCHASEKWQYIPFTVDHILPLTKGGQNTVENLALACFHCNRQKAANTTAVDPHSGLEVPLFHPRQEDWGNHFIWSVDGLFIIGLTSTGRATIAALGLNRSRIVKIRAADTEVNRHPPPGDRTS